MPLKPNPRRFFKHTCSGKYSHKDLNRYSSYVDTTPGLGPKGDCWEWRGYIKKGGYGQFSNNGACTAHRAAYEMATGELIPDGKCVLHKCDNRKCVKAYLHLSLGTHQDNMDDKENKGRGNQASGENHGKAKLTWEIVKEIRNLYATGKYTLAQLSKMFNTIQQNIGSILNNKTWYDPNYIVVRFVNKHKIKLNQEQADKIRIEYATGKYTYKQLADIFGVVKCVIGKIVNNKSWKISEDTPESMEENEDD
jgi:hypothetical protein